VLLRDCCEIPEVFFAAAKLGIIFVPLNFRLVGPELEYQLNNSGCRLIVFHDLFVKYRSNQSRVKEKDKFIYVKVAVQTFWVPEWATRQNLVNDHPTHNHG
jgi:fatty-acyl-CoA synthase